MKKGLNLTLLLAIFALFVSCGEAKQSEKVQQNNNTNITTPTSKTAITEADPAEVEVTIVKYSDYQCPACKYYIPIEAEIKKEFGNRVKIVDKNFPLSSHQYSQLAARAAEAAKKQGKFDEMHDRIYDGQEQWSRGNAESTFIGYAKAIGLDMDQFKKDLHSMELQRLIMADKQEGIIKGVNSTPTFFINGDKIESNPPSYPQFKALIVPYLKK